MKMTEAVEQGTKLADATDITSVVWHNVAAVSAVIAKLRSSAKPNNRIMGTYVEARLAEHFRNCGTYGPHAD